jgi:hypothetical protein
MSYPRRSSGFDDYHDPYAASQGGHPLYPPAALTGSTYSLNETYVHEEEKGDYAAVQPVDEEEERTPFARHDGRLKFDDPALSYGLPSSAPYNRHQGKLSRRETNAEGFRQRQKTLGRARTKKVVLKNGHFIACVHGL